MKKFYRQRLFSMVCFSLIIIGIQFAYPQKSKDRTKPVKIPDYTWSMKIPYLSPNIMSMDPAHVYEDGMGQTRISYTESFDNDTQSMKTSFSIFVDASVSQDEYVNILGASVYDIIDNNEGDPNGFPEGEDLEGFLNSLHPHPDYNHILFRFVVYESLENFPEGSEVSWTGPGAINIYFWNSFDCGDGETVHYHSVNAKVLKLDCVFPAGYYITRTGPDTWRFRIEQQEFELAEHYCIEELIQVPIGGSGKYKTVSETTHYYPQTASSKLSYVFDLTREAK